MNYVYRLLACYARDKILSANARCCQRPQRVRRALECDEDDCTCSRPTRTTYDKQCRIADSNKKPPKSLTPTPKPATRCQHPINTNDGASNTDGKPYDANPAPTLQQPKIPLSLFN